ncbi:hypothetical protein JOE49_005271 [Paenibacillus sp. PvR133]|nr:hypothetical protein [Paenibacillus sp. PvR133]
MSIYIMKGMLTMPFNFQVTPSGLPKFEPSVAVNLLNPNIVVAVAVDFSSGPPLIGLYRSLDAGANWTDSLLPIPTGYTGAEAGMVAYLFPNIFIISAHVFPGNENGAVVIYRSTDDGATFSPPVVINPGFGDYINNDWTNITTDNAGASPYLGHVYVTYNRQYNVDFNAQSTAFYQRSTDGGLTWDRPLLLSNIQSSTERPEPAVDKYGSVYVSWIRTGPQTPAFFIRRSFDGGATFSGDILVSNITLVPNPLPVPGYDFRILNFPSLAADCSGVPSTTNTLYAVWQDFGQGYSNILLSKSSDFGGTWSAPIIVTDSPPGSQNFFPAISVSPKTGLVVVVYYTNRLDGFNLDVFTAQSSDGGNTFTNSRLTTTSFNPNVGGGGEESELIGDYIDVAIVPPNSYLAVWTDTRTGSLTIFAGVPGGEA